MALTIDTRTATEYGVVRTFGQGDFQFTTQANSTTNPAAFTASPSAGTQTGLLNQPGEGYVATEYIFLQFAGFTFGKSASAYATPWQGFMGNLSSFLLGGQNTDTGVNNIQYTAQFGSGVSASIGLDDPLVDGEVKDGAEEAHGTRRRACAACDDGLSPRLRPLDGRRLAGRHVAEDRQKESRKQNGGIAA